VITSINITSKEANMKLGEVFDSVKRNKQVWVRHNGILEKTTVEMRSLPDAERKSKKPMFPISKPRYK